MSGEGAGDRWLIRQRPSPRARLRLFCFPYASGGASVFQGWHEQLPGDIEVAAVQPPGREERLEEPPYRDVRLLTLALVDVLGPYLDRPFALFGHSIGALVAFETARALRRSSGRLPAHLFVSARGGPSRPHQLPPIGRLSDDALVVHLRRLGGTPEEVLGDPDFMSVVLPLFRADIALAETYLYSREEPLACPISAFGATFDEHARREDLSSWREETQGAFRIRMFPGGHFFIHDARARLLQAISEDLAP